MWLNIFLLLFIPAVVVGAALLVTYQRDLEEWDAKPRPLAELELLPREYPPVDLVYTWVDLADAEWYQRYQRAKAAAGVKVAHASAGVQENRELYFAIALAKRHLPWLRQIFIVTQRPQVPAWLSEVQSMRGPPVKVVHHDEFFPSFIPLPTYNGMLTTAFCHLIPGLAEHYVQSEDDVFILQPLSRQYFFDGPNLDRPVLTPEIKFAAKSLSMYDRIEKNSLQALHRIGAVENRSLWGYSTNHAPVPHRRTLVAEACDSVKDTLWARVGRVRSDRDIDFFAVYLPNYLVRKQREQILWRPREKFQFFSDGRQFRADQCQGAAILGINNSFPEAAQRYLEDLL